MSWMNAYARGFVIFVYFLVTTVMLPNFVLRTGAISNASNVIQDVIVLAVWGIALVAGMYLLRRFQRAGRI